MPQLFETESDLAEAIAVENIRAKHRRKLASSLDEIGAEVSAALNAAKIHIPVFFTVPSGGNAYLTLATSLDPSDEEWERTCQIICPIIAAKIGVAHVLSRDLPCVAAGAPIAAADLLSDHGDLVPL
jgi:hypothetical protein